MKNIVKRLVTATSTRIGLFTSRIESPNKVRNLLQKLAPIATEKELIRLGGSNDGGYLIPDDLEGIQYCFSPGVNTTATFEEDLYSIGIESFLADYSVDAPPASLNGCRFDKKYIGPAENATHTTLDNWVEQRLPNYSKDLILQMDIEGFEYPVLIESPKHLLSKFRIIVIEFHNFEQLFNPPMFSLMNEAFEKLLENFRIVHAHPNNYGGSYRFGEIRIPSMVELTFLRKDRIGSISSNTTFPHPLDQQNVIDRPDIVLPPEMIREPN